MSDLATRVNQAQEKQTLEMVLHTQRDELSQALADKIGVDRFIRAAVTAFRATPALQNCDRRSVLGGLYVAAQLGLEIGGPRALAHLVPYGKQAQLIIGYRGYLELFFRAGAQKVEAFVVREGDKFRQWSSGRHGKDYEWEPANDDTSRPLTGAVAQVMMPTGVFIFEYMSKAQIDARRPKGDRKTPWDDWYEEMAFKTVLRALAKTARQSVDDLAVAVANDDAVIIRPEGNLPALVEKVPVRGVEAFEDDPGSGLTAEEQAELGVQS